MAVSLVIVRSNDPCIFHYTIQQLNICLTLGDVRCDYDVDEICDGTEGAALQTPRHGSTSDLRRRHLR
ncbi:hypothetical protein DPMN_135273 [Dreissena polymorpha]|uniref:Uncharacterized protein n=1 Tax=Dreissena polymorpha TaxID=45954 RepID=A0A9D4JFM6_DREPO|nr:hypothetical protein DPMN_135273 [Dreissena polymorpha]